MATLSLSLPDTLAKASQEAASKMGISRAEFIRRAIAQELKHFQEELEEKAMVASMIAMKESKTYRMAVDEITEGSTDFPEHKNGWWQKKES